VTNVVAVYNVGPTVSTAKGTSRRGFESHLLTIGVNRMKTKIDLLKEKGKSEHDHWVVKKEADVWKPTPENKQEAYVEICVQTEQQPSGRIKTETVILTARELELIVNEMGHTTVFGYTDD